MPPLPALHSEPIAAMVGGSYTSLSHYVGSMRPNLRSHKALEERTLVGHDLAEFVPLFRMDIAPESGPRMCRNLLLLV